MAENKQDDCISGDFVADLKCEIELSAEEVGHSEGLTESELSAALVPHQGVGLPARCY